MFAPPRSLSQLTTTFFAGQLLRHPPWTLVRLTIFSLCLVNRSRGSPEFAASGAKHPRTLSVSRTPFRKVADFS